MSTIQIDRTTAPFLEGGSCWQLDLARSRAEFRVKHLWGLTTVTGYFEDFGGALTVAADGELEATAVDQRRLGMTWNRLGVRSPAVLAVSAVLVRG